MQTSFHAQAKLQHLLKLLISPLSLNPVRQVNGQRKCYCGRCRLFGSITGHNELFPRQKKFELLKFRFVTISRHGDSAAHKENGHAGESVQKQKGLHAFIPSTRSRVGAMLLAVVTVAGFVAIPLLGRGLAAAETSPTPPAATAVAGSSTATPAAPTPQPPAAAVPAIAAPRLRTRKLTTEELEWLDQIRSEALKAGISLSTVDRCLPLTIEPLLDVYEADRNQPEFKITFAQYLDRIVCEQRVHTGELMLEEHRDIFEEIASKYSIPENILAALWGVESSYGRICGKWDVIQSLFTLALTSDTPTRRAFFRNELMEAMHIWDAGHVAEGQMLLGSWAGAMGQCQFMPSSFRAYAIDHDGDGKADIWNSRADVLASIANYLSSHGWKKGQPYGQRVTLPPTIDSREFGLKVERSVDEWRSKFGVVTDVEGETPLPGNVKASLIAPDGPSGPAYLACANFRAVMAYNPSTYYATSVGDLAQRLAMRMKAKAAAAEAKAADAVANPTP
eukprot:jgi/Mesvir1/15239/Mv06464-RA.1